MLGLPFLDLLITGSSDRHLRFFEISSGKLKKTIKEAHKDIIRELCLVEDVGFLSVSNDQDMKLWTFEGDSMQEMTGHNGFVFSCAVIGFG